MDKDLFAGRRTRRSLPMRQHSRSCATTVDPKVSLDDHGGNYRTRTIAEPHRSRHVLKRGNLSFNLSSIGFVEQVLSYTLYYAPGAASMVVHWMLIEVGVSFKSVLVDINSSAQRDPKYLRLNPTGRSRRLLWME